MKKITAVLIAAAVACQMCSAVYAEDVLNLNQSGTLAWSVSGGTLTIGGSGEISEDFVTDELSDYRSDITGLVVKDGITAIGDGAFESLKNIKKAELADTVTEIGDGAFYGVTKLEEISMTGVKTIGDFAFYGAGIDEDSAPLPEGLEYIGNNAFASTRYSEFEIPASVKYIGERALNSSSVGRITVDESNENYSSLNKVLFNKDKTELIYYPKLCKMRLNTTRETTADGYYEPDIYEIPDTVLKVADYAFFGKQYLGGVILPASLKQVGSFAFDSDFSIIDASANSNFVMEDGILYDADKTKAYVGLTSQCGERIVLPETVRYVMHGAFIDNDVMTELVLPESVEYVFREAFAYCTKLEKVTLYPNTYLDTYAFYVDISLANVYFRGSRSEWEALRQNAENGNDHMLNINTAVTFSENDNTDTEPKIEEFDKPPYGSWRVTVNTGNIDSDCVAAVVLRDYNTKKILGVKTANLSAGTSLLHFNLGEITQTRDDTEVTVYCWRSLTGMTPIWDTPLYQASVMLE